ncbi:hypothetical protein BDFB_013049, partial [Asbolus verrucosus]
MSTNDPKRKDIINLIRRQGNFCLKSQMKIIRPVRRPTRATGSTENLMEEKDTYVTCQDCFGFFKRQFLRRHRKRCKLRTSAIDTTKRENHLTEAQLFAVCAGPYNEFYDSLRLKNEIFKIMRADKISRVAMGDILISSFAESLLRKHKRTQIRNAISNKMRELVSATKIISGYNPETRTYKASSLALHTTLKQLIHDHWNSEVSSLALKNLNENNWQKPKLLPLTSDIMQFKQYVAHEATKACDDVKNDVQVKKAYRRLTETVLALTLLLNRKHIGEIQYLKVETYKRETSANQQEELSESLSETEKILTKNFKRVIMGGKGSKPVPILFPKTIQNFINVMLSARPRCLAKNNEYLFANPTVDNKWLSGYHILKKLAVESRVNNQNLFSSTRLRKQIATILQVMHVTESEMERFASFMGHTKKTHESYY